MARPTPSCRRAALVAIGSLAMPVMSAVATATTCVDYRDDYASLFGGVYYGVGGNRPYRLHLDDDTMYVANLDGHVLVYDVTGPGDLETIGTIAAARDTWDLTTDGTRLFVVGQDAGLQIFDVADPASPVVLGAVGDLLDGRAVDASGSLACVTGEASGVHVIDVSDPTSPAILGSVPLPDRGGAVEIVGDHAFVAADLEGLVVVDLADPDDPSIVTSVELPSACRDVLVRDDVAYALAFDHGVWIFDVTDPTTPVELSHLLIDEPPIELGASLSSLDLDGTDLVVTDLVGMFMIDVSDSGAPELTGALDVYGFLRDVLVADGVAYTTQLEQDSSIMIFDVDPPRTPLPVGLIDTGDGIWDVQVDGDLAYVPDLDGGFSVVDVSDPLDAVVLGSLGGPRLRKVVVNGNHVYAGGLDALHTIDVSDPTNPIVVHSIPTTDHVNKMVVRGDVLYVTVDGAGLLVADVSSPATPVVIGQLATDGWVHGIALHGDLAFVAGVHFLVVDISDPTAPWVRVQWDYLGDGSEAIVIDGDILFSGGSGVNVWDVALPLEPTIIESIPMGIVGDIHLVGDVLYAATGLGVKAADVSDPTNAVVTASVKR